LTTIFWYGLCNDQYTISEMILFLLLMKNRHFFLKKQEIQGLPRQSIKTDDGTIYNKSFCYLRSLEG
jgi:hypothetical protein